MLLFRYYSNEFLARIVRQSRKQQINEITHFDISHFFFGYNFLSRRWPLQTATGYTQNTDAACVVCNAIECEEPSESELLRIIIKRRALIYLLFSTNLKLPQKVGVRERERENGINRETGEWLWWGFSYVDVVVRWSGISCVYLCRASRRPGIISWITYHYKSCRSHSIPQAYCVCVCGGGIGKIHCEHFMCSFGLWSMFVDLLV